MKHFLRLISLLLFSMLILSSAKAEYKVFTKSDIELIIADTKSDIKYSKEDEVIVKEQLEIFQKRVAILEIELGNNANKIEKLKIDIVQKKTLIKKNNDNITKKSKEIIRLKKDKPTNWGFLSTIFTPDKKREMNRIQRKIDSLQKELYTNNLSLFDARMQNTIQAGKQKELNERISIAVAKIKYGKNTISQLNDINFALKEIILLLNNELEQVVRQQSKSNSKRLIKAINKIKEIRLKRVEIKKRIEKQFTEK